MPKVFLSYAHDDAEFARKLAADLRVRGINVWIDVSDLKPGLRIEDSIGNALRDSDALLVILSRSSLQSQWVRREIEIGLSKSKGLPLVVPIVIDIEARRNLPPSIATYQFLDLSEKEDYNLGLDHLVTRLSLPEGREAEADTKEGGDRPSRQVLADVIDVNEFAIRIAEEVNRQLKTISSSEGGAVGPRPAGNDVFVIMAFSPDMDPIFEGIRAAAASNGLQAKRVKDIIGDYRINDMIISKIRTAQIVVADLTHERPNVYFELGYARGLGKRVVTTAREGSKLHFDVHDWTCVFYDDSRVLEKLLVERFRLEVG